MCMCEKRLRLFAQREAPSGWATGGGLLEKRKEKREREDFENVWCLSS